MCKYCVLQGGGMGVLTCVTYRIPSHLKKILLVKHNFRSWILYGRQQPPANQSAW